MPPTGGGYGEVVTPHHDPSLAQHVAELARSDDLTVAVAESLTCGLLLSELGRAEGASTWLRGGVVAYATDVKRQVLGISPGPVVSAQCAEEMAAGAARLLGADAVVATTGVGGPGTEEGQEPGTVYLGWWFRGRAGSERHVFDGDPTDVVEHTVRAALALLLSTLEPAR